MVQVTSKEERSYNIVCFFGSYACTVKFGHVMAMICAAKCDAWSPTCPSCQAHRRCVSQWQKRWAGCLPLNSMKFPVTSLRVGGMGFSFAASLSDGVWMCERIRSSSDMSPLVWLLPTAHSHTCTYDLLFRKFLGLVCLNTLSNTASSVKQLGLTIPTWQPDMWCFIRVLRHGITVWVAAAHSDA